MTVWCTSRKLGRGKRIAKVEDVVKVGDKLRVEIADIDNRGKISLVLVAEERRSRGSADAAGADGCRDRMRQLSLPDAATAQDTLSQSGAPPCPAVCGSSPSTSRRCVRHRSGCGSVSGRATKGRSVAGAAHFLEHLLFKSTPTRTAVEIAQAVDAVGGELNAFTAKEHTCYYAHVLDNDLELAVDLVADVVLRGRCAAEDVEVERDVVLEEIAMRDDDPEDALGDVFLSAMFGEHPVGRPVIGSVESIVGDDARPAAFVPPAALHARADGRRGGGQHRPRPVVALVRQHFGAASGRAAAAACAPRKGTGRVPGQPTSAAGQPRRRADAHVRSACGRPAGTGSTAGRCRCSTPRSAAD